MPSQKDKFLGHRLDVSVSKWYATCVILRQEREKELEGWKQLHVGDYDGSRCEHLQVTMAQLLQNIGNGRKTGQREQANDVHRQHGHQDSVPCGEVQHIANIMGDDDAHGWITAALLREMKALVGHAAFEGV